MKTLGTIIVLILAIGAFVMFARSPEVSAPTEELTELTEQTELVMEETEQDVLMDDSETVIMTNATVTTNKGTFELELFGELAPKTVENFVTLAESGYYNGTKFHRIIQGFMIQGGDPNTKNDDLMDAWGTGGPGYSFEDEIHAENKNDVGTISMANAGPNTNGSQFFINTAPNNFLDTKHTVFGRVISGMEVIMEIEKTEAPAPRNIPIEPVIIESIVLTK